jgi:hypothetical protein
VFQSCARIAAIAVLSLMGANSASASADICRDLEKAFQYAGHWPTTITIGQYGCHIERDAYGDSLVCLMYHIGIDNGQDASNYYGYLFRKIRSCYFPTKSRGSLNDPLQGECIYNISGKALARLWIALGKFYEVRLEIFGPEGRSPNPNGITPAPSNPNQTYLKF